MIVNREKEALRLTAIPNTLSSCTRMSFPKLEDFVLDIHHNLPRRADHPPRRRLGALPPCQLQPPRPTRGNLELASVVADLGKEAQFRRWAGLGPDVAPENTPACFLAFCGVVGLGGVMARRGGFACINAQSAVNQPPAVNGEPSVTQENPPLLTLRTLASDPRWRIREAVAMALQRWGDADMAGLLAAMTDWAGGNPLEQRAAAAALCEPRLLTQREHAAAVLRDSGWYHGVHFATHRPQERCVQDAAPGVGLLLERRRRRAARRGQAADGALACQS